MDGIGTVGSSQGQVHRLPEGQGLSEILRGNDAVDTYSRMWAVDQAAQARRDQERQAKRQASMAALKSFDPQFLYLHNNEMSKSLNDHFNKGAELLARVDDPFTSSDPQAIEWQKEHARIQAMSTYSLQLKDRWTALQKQIADSNPDDYDARSLDNAVKFFNKPLTEIVANGETPPTLQKKRPMLDSMKFIGERMSGWQSATGAAPTDNEIREFNKGLLNDPANKQQLVEAYGSRLAQMTPEETKALQDRADMAGLPVTEMLMFEDSKRFLKRREPLNYQKELNAAADLAKQGISYNEGANPDASWSNPVKGSKMAAIKAAATAMFNSRDDYMTMFDKNGEVPRGAEMSDQEYAEEVKKYLASQLDPLVGVKTEYKKTDKAGKDAELKQSQEQFIADIRSGDTVRMQGAANALVGEKFAANLTVENAVIQNQGAGNMWLELDVVTPMSTKDIKEQVVDANTGLSAENVNVEERQGKKIIKIGLAPGAISNQTLLGVLGNKKYDTKFTERGAKTAIDAVRAPVNTNPVSKNSPTVGSDFFK